ncbi:Fructose-1,6-bisphosphatase class 2 [Aedoeadaptatus ivorii]|uniref:Fructose-1,6-bisphosphatase n=1 Tax=Aedoeadaptatus ivorii TaxID=54006 RepID=A0A3S4ZQM5_9FIRM|nr:class II fructose-bisphosphatase [Peptoniphilus ivorii]MDQ0507844.1 fructose-1,6-bisphosphatase II [Peptoniphilus ivorii]VEJ35671.1 Fructose-1,6-bisphosphatase class 2 [Peptoniphilus ivorii]
MDRDLSLNLARVTEAAALSGAKYLGKGDKNAADGAAVDAMRRMFDTVHINGTVVIGEGEIDEAPMLYIGEEIGTRGETDDAVDIAVDPIDGTTAIANGMNNAIAVVAVAPKGCLLHAPDVYMKKIACGPKAKGKIRLEDSVEDNIRRVAEAIGKSPEEMTISVLDRDRHEDLIRDIRATGARIKKITDGDIVTAIYTCFEESGIDMIMGIGGAPEGVIAAAALKCLGGDFQGKLMHYDEAQKKRCQELHSDLEKIYTIEDLVIGDDVIFAATGVSEGDLLKGVRFKKDNKATTQSMVLRLPSKTIRFIDSIHDLRHKPEYAK